MTGMTGTSNDYSTCFIGNWVFGGRYGEAWIPHAGVSYLPFTLNFSGNYLNLFPPFNEVGDHAGGAVTVGACKTANVCGNTMVAGGRGVTFCHELHQCSHPDERFQRRELLRHRLRISWGFPFKGLRV